MSSIFGGGGGASGLTIGSTTITGGADTRVLFNDGGVVGEDAGLTYDKTSNALTAGSYESTGNISTSGVGAAIYTTGANSVIAAVSNTGTYKLGASQDVILNWDAANTLALRNGTAAQTYRVYATADGSPGANFQRGIFSAGVATANMVRIGADNGGTGAAAGLEFVTASGAGTGAALRWQMSAAGHLLPGASNTYDIGAAGNTAKDIHSNFFIVGSQLYFVSSTVFSAPADGSLRIENFAGTSFGSLLLGPSGTTFNRIKHDATGVLAIKLADDSAYSGIKMGKLIGAVQSLSGAGAVDLVSVTTAFTSTGVGDALTLADGIVGQIKHIVHVVDGGTGVLTPSNLANGTIITFTNVGEAVTLQFLGTEWWVINLYGAVLA